jgi:TadE-like protein
VACLGFRSRLANFLRESDGSVTIEFVLWLPLLTALIGISADLALYFGLKAQMLRILQDANRAAAIGRLTTEAETEAFIMDSMGDYADVATVTTSFDEGSVITSITIPSADITVTGLMDMLTIEALVVRAMHLLEA